MSKLQVDDIVNKEDTGSVGFSRGAVVTGVATATSFSGPLTGDATGLSGTPNINCGTGSFTLDVDIADKIFHTGDTNTVIRFPAADTFTVETAGSERLRITSDGKFGFKTTSPDYTVDINGELGIKEGQPVTWHDGSGNPAAQIYGDSSSNLIFRTGVAAMGERMRLLPAGGLTFNGDTAAANALDDYEEGTWLPNIGGTATYDIQWGYYIKIGKSVQCWGGLRPNSMGTGNAKQIQNLPFTAINSPGTTYTGGGSIVYHDNSATSIVNTPALAVQPNSTYATINTKTAASIRLQDTNNFWQNNHRANFFITYQTN